MYRIQMKLGKKWKLGLVEYATIQEANKRVIELTKIGHKCKVISNEAIFN